VQAARARRALTFGRDAVVANAARAALLLLAEDAPSLLQQPTVAEFAAQGKLVIWGSKQTFGQWLGRGDVAILSIEETGLAAQVSQTLALLRLATATDDAASGRRESMGKSVSEVR
jgi:hypothetical protein